MSRLHPLLLAVAAATLVSLPDSCSGVTCQMYTTQVPCFMGCSSTTNEDTNEVSKSCASSSKEVFDCVLQKLGDAGGRCVRASIGTISNTTFACAATVMNPNVIGVRPQPSYTEPPATSPPVEGTTPETATNPGATDSNATDPSGTGPPGHTRPPFTFRPPRTDYKAKYCQCEENYCNGDEEFKNRFGSEEETATDGAGLSSAGGMAAMLLLIGQLL